MIGIGAKLSSAAQTLDPLRLDVDGLRPDLWELKGVVVSPTPAASFSQTRIVNSGGAVWNRCNLALSSTMHIGQTVWIRLRTADGTSLDRRIGPHGPGGTASFVSGPLSNLDSSRDQLGPMVVEEQIAVAGGATDLVIRFTATTDGIDTIGIGPETETVGADVLVWGCQVTAERSGWLL